MRYDPIRHSSHGAGPAPGTEGDVDEANLTEAIRRLEGRLGLLSTVMQAIIDPDDGAVKLRHRNGQRGEMVLRDVVHELGQEIGAVQALTRSTNRE